MPKDDARMKENPGKKLRRRIIRWIEKRQVERLGVFVCLAEDQ